MILFLERESPNGINFKSFVNFLSIFSSTSPLSLKLRCVFLILIVLFDLVDTSNDGAITNSDFTFFIQLLVGGYISQNFVSHITHSFMKDKSSLSFVDFCQVFFYFWRGTSEWRLFDQDDYQSVNKGKQKTSSNVWRVESRRYIGFRNEKFRNFITGLRSSWPLSNWF